MAPRSRWRRSGVRGESVRGGIEGEKRGFGGLVGEPLGGVGGVEGAAGGEGRRRRRREGHAGVFADARGGAGGEAVGAGDVAGFDVAGELVFEAVEFAEAGGGGLARVVAGVVGDNDGEGGAPSPRGGTRASSWAGAELATQAEHREGGRHQRLRKLYLASADGAGVVADAEFAEAETGGDGDGGGTTGGARRGRGRRRLRGAWRGVGSRCRGGDRRGRGHGRELASAGHPTAEPGLVTVMAPAAGDVERAGFDGAMRSGRSRGSFWPSPSMARRMAPRAERRPSRRAVAWPRLRGWWRGAAAGPAGDAGGDLGGGGIGAAVVDQNDLVVATEGIEDVDGGADEREDVAGFVEKRDDERVVGRRRHGAAGCGVKTTSRTPGRRPR